MTEISEATVGELFVGTDGRVYKHIAYSGPYPTAIVEDIDNEHRVCAAVGSPLLAGLRLLMPERT